MERIDENTFSGVVENGVIRAEEALQLPDGTKVQVRVLQRRSKRSPPTPRPPRRIPVCAPELLKFSGIIKDLPPDASINVDHYLYGAAKRRIRKPKRKK